RNKRFYRLSPAGEAIAQRLLEEWRSLNDSVHRILGEGEAMDLLASYLDAVRVLLPKRQRDDIVAELSEELRSQIEEREGALGRPLTPEEQNALFVAHGDPVDVARRYRADRRSLALGWELIGPELFPVYRLILAINLSLAVLCTLGYALVLQARVTV